jgi:GAF domain-containing protein
MSVTRKAPTAAKKRDKPRRQRLAEVLAEREAELAEARRQNARLFDEVQAKTQDLEEPLQEALRQQTSTSDILRVIASSPNDLQPVLDNIVETACRLCSAYDAVVLLREGDQLRIVAHHGPIPITFASQQISRGWASGRAVIERRTIHIDDIAEHADEYPVAAALASRGVAAGSGKMLWRANLVVPLMREGEAIGVIGLRRTEPVPFSEGQIELLKTFSDQAVIAIENARLFDEVQAKTRDLTEALEHQTATSEILAAISRSPTEVQPVLDAIARSATELCGATSGGVDRFDGELIHLASHYNWSPAALRAMDEIYPASPSRGFASARSILTRSVVHIPDISKDPEYTATPVIEVGFRSVLAVPMLRDGQPIGAIAIVRLEPRPFPDRQITLLQTFAEQAVIAINNVRLFDEVQAKTRDLEESLQQQTATADVLKVISRSAFDLQAVFDALISSAVNLIGATHGTIYVRDSETFRIRAHFGISERFADFLVRNPPGPGLGSASGRVMLTGKVVVIPDILEDEDYAHPANELNRTRSLLAVPLLRNDRVEGVLVIAQPEPGAFSSRQIELVKTFADQAVIAIENVRLFDEVQARTRDLQESLEQQTASAEILRVISSSPTDVQPVFDAIAHSAAVLCEATNGTVFRLRDGLIHLVGYYSLSQAQLASVQHSFPAPLDRGTASGRAILECGVVHIRDIAADREYSAYSLVKTGLRSVLSVPMLRNCEPIGSINVSRDAVRPFSERQIELLKTFADQAVIAINNVGLFNETREALEQQKATADVLKVISRSAFDLDAVLQTLTHSARSLSGAASADVEMRDGDVLRIRAQSGCDPELVKYIEEHPPKRGTETVAGRVLMSGEAVHIPDVRADTDYDFGEGPQIGNYRALLGAPLIRDGKVDGVFTLMRPEPGAFTPRQIEIVQTFADQAVIAIENARLFDEVQARTRDLTEALQQQTATANVLKVISRSAFDLQAVLTTLAESARDLCGASFVTLSLREGDAMRLRAESGCTPEIVQFMGAHPIRAGRETFTGRVMLSGEAVHLPDVFADPEYDFGEGPRIGNYRALLAVPLLREGRVEGLRGPFGVRQVLGVFALARPDPVPFTERQIEMVRAFADQAVIAIENARLFNEVQSRTKELAASLDDLRKAQDRLIQSEKLASLGQLTAGIAHEIKNPLNFINNYSALSRELVDELAEAIKGAAGNEATHGEADELIGAIGGNLDKIVQHGKRADSIVKNMLLHSREGSGERATTNVNTMVEEALNLAYHGARAEKPEFNVTIAKSLDPNAGAAEVYAQEMSRVLLNLISNGFYATTKRKQNVGDGAYEPTIAASTRDLGLKVEIAIRDNGTGISDEVKAKMFNPFFTTKPAGEGTGLGLSLSHDIVVKQHGGTIEVLTEPDAFTQFTIVLPRGATGA